MMIGSLILKSHDLVFYIKVRMVRSSILKAIDIVFNKRGI